MCQYCETRWHKEKLTLDHVIPRSRGGQLSWGNAVTCCKGCNCKKGDLTLTECKRMDMRLARAPRKPTVTQLSRAEGKLWPRNVHETWVPYLSHVWGEEAMRICEESKGDILVH